MTKIIVFCYEDQKAQDQLEQQYGIPHQNAAYITRATRQMMGFKDMEYLPLRELTASEEEYCAANNITEITVEGMQALQMELTGNVPNEEDTHE